jgi:hypothetical protein
MSVIDCKKYNCPLSLFCALGARSRPAEIKRSGRFLVSRCELCEAVVAVFISASTNLYSSRKFTFVGTLSMEESISCPVNVRVVNGNLFCAACMGARGGPA